MSSDNDGDNLGCVVWFVFFVLLLGPCQDVTVLRHKNDKLEQQIHSLEERVDQVERKMNR